MTQTKAELLQTRHQGDLKLGDADSSHYVGFKAPATVGTNLVWTLPAADGSANQFLKTNASGVLSWGTVDTSTLMPLGGGIHTGNVTFNDGIKSRYGSDADLEVYHDGTNAYIKNATGDILFKHGSEDLIACQDDGEVQLFHDGTQRLRTTSAGITITGAATISTNLTVTGDLTVSGTTTTINTATLDVEDKNVVLGKVSSPSDTTADGGGWTLKGASDKTLNWINATDAWTSSEHIHLLDGKKLFVGGTSGTTDGIEIHHTSNNSFINDSGTGTLQLQLGGSTKLEIQSGGINVTGAINVNGSALASGNTFTAVANGSIANNKAVKIDTDGKVSQIAETFQAANLGKQNGVEFNSSTDTRHSVTLYDPDANRVVTYWSNGQNARLKTTTWAIGSSDGVVSESNVATDDVENTINVINDHSEDHDFDVVYDTNLNKHLFVFTNDSNNNMYCKYGTYNSSNYKVEYVQGQSGWTQVGSFAGSNPDLHYDPTTDRYVCVYRKTQNGYPYYVVGNQSGGTISWGTPTIIESATIHNGNHVHVCSFGAGKVCFLWKLSSGNTVKTALGVISTSSNTLSNLYSSTTVSSAGYGMHRLCYNEEDDNIIYGHTGSDGYGYTTRFTRNSGNNGIDVSSASSYIVQDGLDAGHLALIYAPVTKTVHIMLRQGSDMYRSRVTNTSGTPTNASTSSANSHDIKFIGEPCAGPASLGGNEKMYVGLYNETRNNRGDMWQMSGITAATNLLAAERYVGFADQAYTNGQTATIKTYGNHVDTLSGLTIGSRYYVQGDGTVGTSQDTPVGRAGLAIATNKLIIMYPQDWGG